PCCNFQAALPPHPDPLPKGEGECFGSRTEGQHPVNSKVGQRALPLLGERAGMRGTATRELYGFHFPSIAPIPEATPLARPFPLFVAFETAGRWSTTFCSFSNLPTP